MMGGVLNSDHVNYLIWRYLQEHGYGKSAVQLSREWRTPDPQELSFASSVKPHTLVQILQDGIAYDSLSASISTDTAKPEDVALDQEGAFPSAPDDPRKYAFVDIYPRRASNVGEELQRLASTSSTKNADIDSRRKRPRLSSNAAGNQDLRETPDGKGRRKPSKPLSVNVHADGDAMDVDSDATPRIEADWQQDQAIQVDFKEEPIPIVHTLDLGHNVAMQSEVIREPKLAKTLAKFSVPGADIVKAYWEPADVKSLMVFGGSASHEVDASSLETAHGDSPLPVTDTAITNVLPPTEKNVQKYFVSAVAPFTDSRRRACAIEKVEENGDTVGAVVLAQGTKVEHITYSDSTVLALQHDKDEGKTLACWHFDDGKSILAVWADAPEPLVEQEVNNDQALPTPSTETVRNETNKNTQTADSTEEAKTTDPLISEKTHEDNVPTDYSHVNGELVYNGSLDASLANTTKSIQKATVLGAVLTATWMHDSHIAVAGEGFLDIYRSRDKSLLHIQRIPSTHHWDFLRFNWNSNQLALASSADGYVGLLDCSHIGSGQPTAGSASANALDVREADGHTAEAGSLPATDNSLNLTIITKNPHEALITALEWQLVSEEKPDEHADRPSILASADTAGVIKFFDGQTPAIDCIRILSMGNLIPAATISFSPDGKFLAAAGDKCVHVWETKIAEREKDEVCLLTWCDEELTQEKSHSALNDTANGHIPEQQEPVVSEAAVNGESHSTERTEAPASEMPDTEMTDDGPPSAPAVNSEDDPAVDDVTDEALTEADGSSHCLAWNQDGRLLAYALRDKVRVLEINVDM